MKKAIKWTFYLLLLAGMAVYGWWEMTKPLPVALSVLEPVDLAVTFRETGTVAAAGYRDLYPETSLTIKEVHVSEGDAIQKGDVLVLLDTDPLERQLQTLEAQMAGVETSRDASLRSLKDQIAQQTVARAELQRQLAVAKTEQTRVQQLVEQHSATQAELDAADNAVEAIQGALRQADEALSLLRAQVNREDSETDRVYQSQQDVLQTQADALRAELEKAVLTAPVSGTVTAVLVKPEQPASPLSPLLRMMEDGQKSLEVYVRSEDLQDIRIGMEAHAIREGRSSDQEFQAVVRSVAPSTVERLSALGLVEKRVKVVLDAPEFDAFIDGTDVDVVFTTQEVHGVIAVPKTAVFHQDGQDAVWVMREGVAVLQPITTGLETDLNFEVTDGLSDGDALVRDPNVEGLKAGKALTALAP